VHHSYALQKGLNLQKLGSLLFLACLLFHTNAAAQLKETRRVLVFNELGLWSSRDAAIDQEIFATLERSPYRIEFYTENLDANLFPNNAAKRQFRDWYLRKYRDRPPDVIIAIGPSPIWMMAESHDLLAPNTPIVFWGSTEEFTDPPKLDSNFTGVWGAAQPEKTLEAALHLQRGIKHVVVVGGAAPYDRHLEALVKERFRSYESKVEFTYLTDLAMPDLLERLKHLPSHTIVYHTSIMQDAAGTQFDDETQSVPMVASAANAPVFVVDDVDVGKGTVGGDVFSSAMAGRVASEMALRILNGENPRDIPIVRGADTYMFDWRALRRWGLKESDLPSGSVVLEREPTFWETYKRYIVAGILAFLAQTLVIIALLWQRSKRRQTEAQLVRYSEQLHLAMESGKSVGWEWDLITGQDSWFGDLRTMFGISSDRFTGQVGDFFRYIHPDDRNQVAEAVADARQKHMPYRAEFRVVTADSAVRWVVSKGTFEYGRNGEAKRMLGMAVDITERKQTEEALRESQKRLDGIIASAMDAVIAVNEEHRIVVFNAAAEKMFGCPAQGAIGSLIDRFIPERFRTAHTEHIRHFETTGVTNRAMGTLGALWGLRANGEEFPIEVSISQLRTVSDKLFTAIIRDVTEREKAGGTRRLLAAIVESSDDAILSMDLEGVILSWNPGAQRLYGYTEAEALGQPIAMVIPAELREEENQILRRLEAGEPIERFETIRVTRDGQRIDVSLAMSPVRDSTGNVVGASKIVRDITEQKRAEASLLWRLEFEGLLSDLSTKFINLPEKDVSASIERSLDRIGEFLRMDRIRLFEFSSDGRRMEAIFSWQRAEAGVAPPPDILSTDDLMWWTSRLLRGEACLASDLNALPREALAEREYLRQKGIASAAWIPLKVAGEVNGAISFVTTQHRVSWTEDLVSQLRSIGEIFWNALRHARAMEKLLASQATLQKSEENSRELVNRSPIAMLVTRGPELRIIVMNDQFIKLFGYTLQDVPDVAHWWPLAYPDEAYRSTVKAEWNVRVERALRDHTGIDPMEAIVRCKDGSSRYIEFHFSPVGDANVVSFVDLTDRKQAETVLQESEERFRLVANAAPVMIWMSGSDKLCTYFNQTWLKFTGQSIHAELGNGWTKGVHPEDFDRCLETYTTAFEQREFFEMEYRLRRYDGEYRWILDLGVPRFNQSGSFAGYIGSCFDVTERRLAEEALSNMSRKLIEAHEEERTRIARELHDDINQRIAFLTVNLDRLRQELPASAVELKNRFEEEIKSLSDVASEIQALSHRLHSSKLEYLGLTAAAASFCNELSARQTVEVDFHSEGVPKRLPQEISLCLFRVLQEALQNATKHSGSKRFHVSLTCASNEIHLSVSDSGIGFDLEDALKGNGLGLISMKERLKLVDGELSIDTHVQGGTTVRALVALDRGAKFVRAAG
jgi:PAS domain S-box-containing protein